MSNEKIISLLKKLKELSERGVDGEKQTAREKLEMLMAKHDITWEQLTDEKQEVKKHSYVFDDEDKTFFFQVCSSVVPDCFENIYYYPNRRKKKGKTERLILCTDAQFLELVAKYEFYLPIYKKELKTFYRAFIMKNNLTDCSRTLNDNELTKEELEEFQKAMDLMRGMRKHEFRKRLTEGNDKN